MPAPASRSKAEFTHGFLDSGVELAVDRLPERNTVAMCFRMLAGVADDPPELTGISAIVERTLSKGTANYDGRALADAFDAIGAAWGGASGRQSSVFRLVCLPEFTLRAVELMAEMICRPTFPRDACQVAVRLAQEELRHMEDDPHELLRADVQRLTLGPVYGRYPGGQPETLARITPERVRRHWERTYHAGRLQVAVAGPVDVNALRKHVDACFTALGSGERAARAPADFEFKPNSAHREKDLKQQYIGFTLPGAAKGHPDFPVEQVLMGVLSGGMSSRLFTEVREKRGLVYWVGAWHEQPRGRGVIHFGASTTPDNCERTYQTLLGELERLHEDLTDEETGRARDGLIAHMETEDDLTRARAASLSDDLFHFSQPVGLDAKIQAIRAVTAARIEDYAMRLPRDRICVATVGPRKMTL